MSNGLKSHSGKRSDHELILGVSLSVFCLLGVWFVTDNTESVTTRAASGTASVAFAPSVYGSCSSAPSEGPSSELLLGDLGTDSIESPVSVATDTRLILGVGFYKVRQTKLSRWCLL